jgi:hypothetical protein
MNGGHRVLLDNAERIFKERIATFSLGTVSYLFGEGRPYRLA